MSMPGGPGGQDMMSRPGGLGGGQNMMSRPGGLGGGQNMMAMQGGLGGGQGMMMSSVARPPPSQMMDFGGAGGGSGGMMAGNNRGAAAGIGGAMMMQEPTMLGSVDFGRPIMSTGRNTMGQVSGINNPTIFWLLMNGYYRLSQTPDRQTLETINFRQVTLDTTNLRHTITDIPKHDMLGGRSLTI